MERDLASWTEECEAHKHNGNHDLWEDKLMLKLCGPKCAGQVAFKAANGVWTLADFGKECASLWRQVYGARLGCYDRKRTGQKVAKASGTWASRKRGVLEATSQAVAASRAEVVAKTDPATMFGVKQSVLAAAGAADRAAQFNNAGLDRFSALTKKKKYLNGVLQTGKRNAFPKFKAKHAAAQPPQPGKMAISRVCFIGQCEKDTMKPLAHCETVIGATRCSRSNLVVVDNLTSLHTTEDDGMLGHMILIFGKGVSVVCQSSLIVAGGVPHKLSSDAVIHHDPICKSRRILFSYTRGFALKFRSVVQALQTCAALSGSKWRTEERSRDTLPTAAGANEEVLDLQSSFQPLAEWFVSNRRICTQLGPKILSPLERVCA